MSQRHFVSPQPRSFSSKSKTSLWLNYFKVLPLSSKEHRVSLVCKRPLLSFSGSNQILIYLRFISVFVFVIVAHLYFHSANNTAQAPRLEKYRESRRKTERHRKLKKLQRAREIARFSAKLFTQILLSDLYCSYALDSQ